MYSQYLLGFDARVSRANNPYKGLVELSASRFLKHPIPDYFCSVDPDMWYSVFDTGNPLGVIKALQDIGMKRVPTPEWIGPQGDHWDDLYAMYDQLWQYHDQLPYPFDIVALTWVANREPLMRYRDPGPHLEPTTPDQKDPSWQFLGYDVADGFLWSALTLYHSNTDAKLKTLRKKWGSRLNEVHLFKKRQDALLYCARLNPRFLDSCHRFQVYGLWKICHITNPQRLFELCEASENEAR